MRPGNEDYPIVYRVVRDFEGRSALLLTEAKDNNASCALGPFIRLFDGTFTAELLTGRPSPFRGPLHGRWLTRDGLVLAALAVPPAAGP